MLYFSLFCDNHMNDLFLCTGNLCHSILTEVTFNHLVSAGWHTRSAGSHPVRMLHPYDPVRLKVELDNVSGVLASAAPKEVFIC